MTTTPSILQELDQSICRAHRASRVLLTFSAIFGMAAWSIEGDREQAEKFPSMVEISELLGTLALSTEDALLTVENKFDSYKKRSNHGV